MILTGITNFFISPVLWVLYLIFTQGPLELLNLLWYSFNLLSGISVGKLFFNNEGFVNGTISFAFNWSNPIVQSFVYILIAGVVFLIFSCLFTVLLSLFRNKVSESMSENHESPLRIFKWFFAFPFIVLAIPFGFILISAITNFFSEVLEGALGKTNWYQLTQANLDFLNGDLKNGVNELNSFDYQTFIDSFIEQINNVDRTNLSETNIEYLDNALNYLNELKTTGLENLDQLSNALSQIKITEKNPDLATEITTIVYDNYLTPEVFTNWYYVNYYVDNLTTNQIIDLSSWTYYEDYQKYFINNGLLNAIFKSQYAISYFNNDNAIGFLGLSTYLIENGSETTFFGSQFVYEFMFGKGSYYVGAIPWPDDFIDTWQIYIKWFIAEVFIIAAGILMIMFLVFLVKRLFELACYFILSPIVVASAPVDEGARPATWLRLIIAKLIALLCLQVSFAIFLTLYQVFRDFVTTDNTLSQAILSPAAQIGFGITMSFSDFLTMIFLLGGMVSAYFMTTKFAEYVGDDTNIQQTFAEMAILSKATGIALAPAKLGLSFATKGVSTGIGKVASATKNRVLHGKKFNVKDKEGNWTKARFGGWFDKRAYKNQWIDEQVVANPNHHREEYETQWNNYKKSIMADKRNRYIADKGGYEHHFIDKFIPSRHSNLHKDKKVEKQSKHKTPDKSPKGANG